MITKITGVLTHVFDDEARLQVEHLEYQVMVTEFVRRQLQTKVGEEVTFHTLHFFEGNPVQQGRMIPRLIGFLQGQDLEFFDLFCSVDKIGMRKAIKALSRPVHDIAGAISREDAKWLTTLPGIGAATADQIVTSLKRKVTRYSMAPIVENGEEGSSEETVTVVDGNLVEDAYQAMLGVGLSPMEARSRLDKFLGTKTYSSAEELLNDIFSQQQK